MQKLSRSGTYRLDKKAFRVDILPRFDDSLNDDLIAPSRAIHHAVAAISILGIVVLFGSLIWSIFHPNNVVLIMELGKMVITILMICLLYANLYRAHQVYVLISALWISIAILSLAVAVGLSLNKFLSLYERPICLLSAADKCEFLHNVVFCISISLIASILTFLSHLDMKYVMMMDREGRYRDTDQPTYVSAVGAGFGGSESIVSIKQSPICAFEHNCF